MTHRPFVAYTARDKMPCDYHTLVIRNAALTDKFDGGLDAFLRKHLAECNHEIVVDCFMSGNNTMKIIDDIFKCGLKPIDDFVIFDTSGYTLGRAAASSINYMDDNHEVDLGVDWLSAEISPYGFYVWYVGNSIADRGKGD